MVFERVGLSGLTALLGKTPGPETVNTKLSATEWLWSGCNVNFRHYTPVSETRT